MLKSTSQKELATQFLEFVSSPEFQNVIPTTNWMYPAFDAKIPEGFKSLAQPTKSFLFNSEIVASNQKKWIDEWLESSIR